MMVVLKNALLILLMILILHYMIKNRIIEEKNAFKRKLIHIDTIRAGDRGFYTKENMAKIQLEQKEVIANVTHAGSGMMGKISADASKEALEDVLEKEVTAPPLKMQAEEKNLLDSINTPVINPPPQIKPDKMKELYDFVYSDEETHSSNNSINKYFPDNVTDHTRVDKNDTTEHSKKIIDKLKANPTHSTCNFEVIGSMCSDSKQGNDIQGVEEQSTASFYSEL